MLCPACSAVISDTAKVCGYCGTRVVETPLQRRSEESVRDEVPPAPAAAAVEPAGAQPAQPSSGTARPAPAGPRRERRRRRWGWALAVVLVVAAATVATLVILQSADRDLQPAPATTAAAQPPFVGGWQAVDAEGHVLFLWILPTAERDRYQIVSHDESSGLCDSGAPALVEARGTGVSPSAVLQGLGTFACLYREGRRILDTAGNGAGIEYRYVTDSGSLTDSFLGLAWNRVNTEMGAVFDPALLAGS